jgi:8-oxo-dGTP diphosphatase
MNLGPLLAALVVVEQDGKILLIQEAKAACRGLWFLPGGRATPGESIPETAVREVREESGLEVALTGLLYVDHLLPRAPEGDAGRLRFVFVSRPIGGRLRSAADEHSLRAGWFSPAEMEDLDLRSPFVERMVAVFQHKPGLLSLSSFHTLSEEEGQQEKP